MEIVSELPHILDPCLWLSHIRTLIYNTVLKPYLYAWAHHCLTGKQMSQVAGFTQTVSTSFSTSRTLQSRSEASLPQQRDATTGSASCCLCYVYDYVQCNMVSSHSPIKLQSDEAIIVASIILHSGGIFFFFSVFGKWKTWVGGGMDAKTITLSRSFESSFIFTVEVSLIKKLDILDTVLFKQIQAVMEIYTWFHTGRELCFWVWIQ